MPPLQKFYNLRVLFADRRGAVTLDYAVLGAGMIVAALVAINSLGGTLDRRFTEIGQRIAVPASGGSASPSAVPAATAPLPGGGPSQGIHSGSASSSGGTATGTTATGTTATGKSETGTTTTGTTTTGTSATGAGGGSGGASGSGQAAQTGTGTGSGGASSGGTSGTTSGGATGGSASGPGTTAGTTPKNCRTVGNGRNARVVCEDDDD